VDKLLQTCGHERTDDGDRNLRALKHEEWQVHQIVNSRKDYWRAAQMLSVALTNKITAKLGYISMLDYYQTTDNVKKCTFIAES